MSILKQFETWKEPAVFLKDIQKLAIEKMFEGELDALLDYDMHQKTKQGNSRNGNSSKKVKTNCGEEEIQVHRDRDSSFNPMLISKRKNMIEGKGLKT